MDEELRWARDSLGVEIVDFPDLDKRDDFEGLAALIANLDLFVGTGTTTTEFAALVGCPTIYASPVSMNAYRNPDLSETDRYFAHVRHVRPIPASNRGPMMARIQELVGEAVAAKAAGQPTRPAAPTQLETTVLVAAQPAQTVQARSGGYRRGRRQRKIHA